MILVQVPVPKRARWSREIRAEISNARRRTKHSGATRKKIAKRLKGKPKPQVHREAIARALRGHAVSDMTRMKMSMSADTRNFRVITNPG